MVERSSGGAACCYASLASAGVIVLTAPRGLHLLRVRVRVRVRVKVRVGVRVRVSNAPLPPFGSEIPQRTHLRPSVYMWTTCVVGRSVVMPD